MTRATSKIGAALFALTLGAACSSSKDEPTAQGSGGDATMGSGGSLTLGSGGSLTLGSGGSVTLGSGGSTTVGRGGSGGSPGGATATSGNAGSLSTGTSGNAGAAGSLATAGAAGSVGTAGNTGAAGNVGAAGNGGNGTGTCCPSGNCICRDPVPTSLTGDDGPYKTTSYDLSGVGCVYHPTDAEAPFSAVAISDGLLGTGGCTGAQTGGWGPFLASWGIVTMIVNTGAADQPPARGTKLLGGIAGFKAENSKSGSPLFGKLAGRYGTSGFSMGGGGTTRAATEDSTLLSSVGIMAWSPVGEGVTVPTLFICGSSDGLAGCASHGTPAYNDMPESTPKLSVTVQSGHIGQPSAGSDMSGAWGLAFHKVFLDGDERWRPLLVAGDSDATTIK